MNEKIKAGLVILFILVVGGIADSYGDPLFPEKPMSASEALSILKYEEASYDDLSMEYPIRLMVFEQHHLFYVIPTCWAGSQHSDAEAVDHFKRYRVHLGGFRSRTLASNYAEMLSELNDDDWAYLIH